MKSTPLKVGDTVTLRKRQFGEPLIYGSEGSRPINTHKPGGLTGIIDKIGMSHLEVKIEGHGIVSITDQDINHE